MSPRLRVLYVPREAYPTDRVRINVLFGRELARRGIAVDLVAQAAGPEIAVGPRDWPGGTAWLGPTDARDGFAARLRKRWLGLRHQLQALRLATPERYDVLVVSDTFVYAAIAALVARRRGLAYAYWLTFPYPELELHGARARTARYPWAAWASGRISAWLLRRVILPRSRHVFVQSARMGAGLIADGVPAGRITPILTGFDRDEVVPVVVPAIAPAAGSAHAAGAVVAYLGTLSADRRLEVLIDALARLRAGGRDVRLLLIGDAHRPRDRALLEARARAAGVESALTITGFLPQHAALSLAGAADVCISPIARTPIFDVGSPTKLVEYLALARPVVANDHPEQREILRDCRAGVCTPWGARHFARAIAWLLDRDPAERAAMGARGREWALAHRTYARIADPVERALLATGKRSEARETGRCRESITGKTL